MDCWFRSSVAFALGGGLLIGVGGCNSGEPGADSGQSGRRLTTGFPGGQADAGGKGAGQEYRGGANDSDASGSTPSS